MTRRRIIRDRRARLFTFSLGMSSATAITKCMFPQIPPNISVINAGTKSAQKTWKTYFFSPKEIIDYLNQADQVIKEKENLLNTLNEEKRKTEQEMEKTYRAYVNDEITMESFGKRYRPLEERLKQIDHQIPELQGEIDFLKIQYISSDQILNEAKDLYSRWPELNSNEKRKIIENITEKIVVGTDDITINLCYIPISSKIMTTEQRNHMDSWPRRA
jgi:site-specific DNA recombinase